MTSTVVVTADPESPMHYVVRVVSANDDTSTETIIQSGASATFNLVGDIHITEGIVWVIPSPGKDTP